jgi:hypothetical protein
VLILCACVFGILYIGTRRQPSANHSQPMAPVGH